MVHIAFANRISYIDLIQIILYWSFLCGVPKILHISKPIFEFSYMCIFTLTFHLAPSCNCTPCSGAAMNIVMKAISDASAAAGLISASMHINF